MKRNIVLVICLSLFLVLLAGCQQPAPKPGIDGPESGLTTSDRRVISDKLAKQAREVEGVQNATVVLADTDGNDAVASSPTPGQTKVGGLTAMVGLTIKSGSDENEVKTQVESKLKTSDKRISHVLVTTDPKLIEKIQDVAAGLLEGKPFKSMQDNIDTINREIQDKTPSP